MIQRRGPNLWILTSFHGRMLLDLQFRSIILGLKEWIRDWPENGRLLDFGSGTEPYRRLWPTSWTVLTLEPDPSYPAHFRDLESLPSTEFFDRIVVLEVLEHHPFPEDCLRKLKTHLRPHGEIIVSVPFSARIHPCPDDYRRWTPQGLAQLCQNSGLEIRELRYRGGGLSSVTAKILYLAARNFGWNLQTLWNLLLSPLLLILLICQWRRSNLLPPLSEDPLGFILRLASPASLR